MTKYNLFGCIIAIIVAIMIGSCARYTDIPLPSVDFDKTMGRKMDLEVKTMKGVYKSANLTPLVQKVGKRVASLHADQRFRYEFAIVDQATANAFALPNGKIYVSRGLLELTTSEDELAQVLGHEIVHVSRRHMARRLARARVPAFLSMPGKIVGVVLNERLGDLVNAPLYLTGSAVLFKYDRQDEFESDAKGQTLAAQAGYDPTAMGTILNRMAEADQIRTGKERKCGFFCTHPSTPDRFDRVTRAAREITWSPRTGVSGHQEDYLRRLEGLLVGNNPADGILRERKFLHPVSDFAVIFPDNWKPINTRQAALAQEPNKEALIILKVAGQNVTAREKANSFRRRLKDDHGLRPVDDRAVQLGELPAYLLTYADTTGRELMNMHFLWFEYKGLLYEFNGFGPERYRPILREAALSFRPLTAAERKTIMETRLHIAAARTGETLEELTNRTNNVWSLEYTAAANGLAPDQPLLEGDLVKVAVEGPFFKNEK